jgi:hypothetical protein
LNELYGQPAFNLACTRFQCVTFFPGLGAASIAYFCPNGQFWIPIATYAWPVLLGANNGVLEYGQDRLFASNADKPLPACL